MVCEGGSESLFEDYSIVSWIYAATWHGARSTVFTCLMDSSFRYYTQYSSHRLQPPLPGAAVCLAVLYTNEPTIQSACLPGSGHGDEEDGEEDGEGKVEGQERRRIGRFEAETIRFRKHCAVDK